MRPYWKTLLAGAVVSAVALVGAAAAEPAKTPAPVIVQATEDGPVFATAAGKTLYTFSREDSSPGKALCNSDHPKETRDPYSNVLPIPNADHRPTCVDKWTPFTAQAGAAASGPWSLVKRDDGSMQWAYEGHPLYSAVKDQKPGDVYGVDLGRFGGLRGWRPAMAPLDFPPGIKLVRLPEGLVMASADGQPLFTRHGAQKVCNNCQESLQALRVGALAEAHGDWSIVELGNGRRQLAYKGQPLYTPPQVVDRREVQSGWAPAVWRKSAGIPAAISTRFSIIGDIYTTKEGMALYAFSCGSIVGDGVSCDDPGDSAAYRAQLCGTAEQCAQRWRLLRATGAARPVGEWSVVDVPVPLYGDVTGYNYRPSEAPGTVKAWAYRGRPLYTYANDEMPGQILGHGTTASSGASFDAIPVPGAGVQE